MIALAILLLVGAAALILWVLMGLNGNNQNVIHFNAWGVDTDIKPLTLFALGALALLLIWAATRLIAAGTRRKLRKHKETRELKKEKKELEREHERIVAQREHDERTNHVAGTHDARRGEYVEHDGGHTVVDGREPVRDEAAGRHLDGDTSTGRHYR